MSELVQNPTRILFFTGKGGAGKTSAACATAIELAEAGKRVLLISTDPASNLDEVLGVTLTTTPRPVPGLARLAALNVDPERAAHAYRERVVGPYRGILPAAALASIEEQLSGACTVEIAAFDEFSKLLADDAATAEFEHVIFDTAPTGHTLRLLALPSAWSSFIEGSVGGTSCLGPLAGLRGQLAQYAAAEAKLRDGTQTTLVLVARAERASLREAARSHAELRQLGFSNFRLIINGFPEVFAANDATSVAMAARARAALGALPASLRELSCVRLPLQPAPLVGIAALRGMSRLAPIADAAPPSPVSLNLPRESCEELLDELAAPGHGVIMTMGKGGVGKTTLAALVAGALARRGFKVTLTTTDPAAHVAETARELGADAGLLEITRIDPALVTHDYVEQVLATAGAGLDAPGRALLEEDLRSPCTEEIAVFRAFADTVAAAEGRFVVIDTAPTGHTLLLLDATESYHREVLKRPSGSPEAVQRLLPRLRDARFTRILLVTLPEATPVHEAMQLERDLVRAEIQPFAWVVNQTLTPLELTDPVLCARRAAEAKYLREVAEHASRLLLVPWRADPA
jgi:arsenite-transporting ATPase